MSHPTDVSRFFEDLDGGVLAERLGTILSHAAGAATNNPTKKAKVSIELTVSNIGKGSQVGIIHKLAFKIPTEHGDQAETHTTETVMYVNQGGPSFRLRAMALDATEKEIAQEFASLIEAGLDSCECLLGTFSP